MNKPTPAERSFLRRFLRKAATISFVFASLSLVMSVIYYRRGQLSWHTPLEIAQLVAVMALISLTGGVVLTAISEFFDWIGIGVEKNVPPSPAWVRATALAFTIVVALYFMFRPNP